MSDYIRKNMRKWRPRERDRRCSKARVLEVASGEAPMRRVPFGAAPTLCSAATLTRRVMSGRVFTDWRSA